MSQTQQEEELEVVAVEALVVAKVAVIKEEKEDKAAKRRWININEASRRALRLRQKSHRRHCSEPNPQR